jgi:NAD(P)-dependent dehydrogenase (short-subunit alcohol dehydrogenase family)
MNLRMTGCCFGVRGEPTVVSFQLKGKTAIVTGGSGALGGAMARGLAAAGASVVVLSRRPESASQIVEAIRSEGGTGMAVTADVTDREQLERAISKVLDTWNGIDILVNAAGGNVPAATVFDQVTLFNLSVDAFRSVVELNLTGTLLPIQVFGEVIAAAGCGSIINISSMAAQKPLTRVVGYSAAKGAVDNLTRWLAVHMAQAYGQGVRVNAIAPGFFVGEQNRALLLNSDGSLTERGRQIVNQTPMGRFGEPEELIGTAVWLASDASRFVTGVVVPVDGGFSAFGGI